MTEILDLNLNDSITTHAWNRDRTQLALSLNSKEVYIFTKTKSNWSLVQTLTEHSSKVLSIDWAPQTNRIVTCGADKNAYVWSFDSQLWKPELVVLRINRAATCVKWSPNEQKFAVGCGNQCICVCYYEKDQSFWVAKHIKKQIRSTTLCLDWHPNNALIAAGGTDFKCRIFGAHISEVDGPLTGSTPWASKITSADCLAEYSASNHGWVYSCAFNFTGNLLAFVAHDSTIYMVDADRNPQQVISMRTTFLPFLTMKFLSNTSVIAGGHDCYPVVFGLNSDKINILEKLDVSFNTKQSNSSMIAREIFQNRERKNEDASTDTSLSSIHQNSIKCINIYKQDNKNKVIQISTSGLDGKIVIWDLNALEQKFGNLSMR